jgi:hypothetical protein
MFSASNDEKKKHWKAFGRLLEAHLDRDEDSSFCPEDLVCEALPGHTGADWILGNALETILRFKHNKKEEELLRIAVLGYAAWLKMGFASKGEKHPEPKKSRAKSAPKQEEGIKGEAGGGFEASTPVFEETTVQG